MKQVTRLGIEIDVCQTSGGVWLDKGELEKMISMIRAEQPRTKFGLRKSKPNAQNPQTSHTPQPAQQQQFQNTREHTPHHRDVEDSAFDKLEAIIDLFDF